jgi:glutamate---cysteine ligase / carboxylate-amine ligase
MVSRMPAATHHWTRSVTNEVSHPGRGPWIGGSWATWNPGAGTRYTLGVEEEVMLLDRADGTLAQRSDEVLMMLSDVLVGHTSPETHASVIELATGINAEASAAVGELVWLREQLARELRELDLAPASTGMHPLATAGPSRVSGGKRYRLLSDSLRSLAHREPTAALHVHVGIPSASDAIRVLNRFREATPVLLALSANSPFCAGKDSGFASARTIVFGAFPRTGPPRAFDGYRDYVEATGPLIAGGALPDLTFLWWDVRLQPALGTVEVRVMDSQSTVRDSAALIALIQSLARLELEGRADQSRAGQEVLTENRFLAARDGLDARLIDPASGELVPVWKLVVELVDECRPHAAALGCSTELEQVLRLASANGAIRQRRWANQEGDLRAVVSTLADRFATQQELFSSSIPAFGRSD